MPGKDKNGRIKYDKFDYKVGSKSELIGFALGIILLAVSLVPLIPDFPADLMCMISAVLCSYPAVIDAFYGLKKKKLRKPLLAVIIIIGLMIIGRFFDAALCAVLIRTGDMTEKAASRREKKLLAGTGKAIAETGHLVREDGGSEITDASEIAVGNALAVLPGEVVPVDALIEEGKGAFDMSLITGDTTPVLAGPGDTVPAGAVNGQSTVYCVAYRDKESSAACRLYRAVSDACGGEFPGGKHRKTAKYLSALFIIAGILLAVIGSIVTGSPFDYICRGLGVCALCFTGSALSGARLIAVSSLIDAAGSGAVLASPEAMGRLIESKTVLLCGEVFAKRTPDIKSAVALIKNYGVRETDAVIPEGETAKAGFAKQCGIDRVFSGEELSIKTGQKLIIDNSETEISERYADEGDFTAVYNYLGFDKKADAVFTGPNLLRVAEAIRKCLRYRGVMRLFTLFFAAVKIAAAALAGAGIIPVWVSFAADIAILAFAFIACLNAGKTAKEK